MTKVGAAKEKESLDTAVINHLHRLVDYMTKVYGCGQSHSPKTMNGSGDELVICHVWSFNFGKQS